MRSVASLWFGLLLATPAAAQTRIIAETNGWRAFGGTAENGIATCGLETRDPNTGRHVLLQHLIGQDPPILRLSRPGWTIPPGSSRPVRIVIDNRRIFAGDVPAAGREISWPLALESFEPAFRRGAVMRIEFPAGPDAPWNLSLRGTNGVMGAFMGCLRMMVIRPGEAPPAEPPPIEAPPMPPPAEEPLRPPVEAPRPVPPPIEAPRPVPPPSTAPRQDLPADKPRATDKAAPDVKPDSRTSPVPL